MILLLHAIEIRFVTCLNSIEQSNNWWSQKFEKFHDSKLRQSWAVWSPVQKAIVVVWNIQLVEIIWKSKLKERKMSIQSWHDVLNQEGFFAQFFCTEQFLWQWVTREWARFYHIWHFVSEFWHIRKIHIKWYNRRRKRQKMSKIS